MKKHLLKVDSRNRISLTKVAKNLPDIFRAYMRGDAIILEPVREIPEHEKWLFEPENKKILEHIKEGLKEKELIDLGSFEQHLND
jgi:hypothetical protein